MWTGKILTGLIFAEGENIKIYLQRGSMHIYVFVGLTTMEHTVDEGEHPVQ